MVIAFCIPGFLRGLGWKPKLAMEVAAKSAKHIVTACSHVVMKADALAGIACPSHGIHDKRSVDIAFFEVGFDATG